MTDDIIKAICFLALEKIITRYGSFEKHVTYNVTVDYCNIQYDIDIMYSKTNALTGYVFDDVHTYEIKNT